MGGGGIMEMIWFLFSEPFFIPILLLLLLLFFLFSFYYCYYCYFFIILIFFSAISDILNFQLS